LGSDEIILSINDRQKEEQMPAMAISTERIDFGTPSRTIACGKTLKAVAGQIEINFGIAFAEPPLVFLTPEWTGPVGYIETVTGVDIDKFRVSSNNAAANYHVNWMAIGRRA
jgi:hypothetical protein